MVEASARRERASVSGPKCISPELLPRFERAWDTLRRLMVQVDDIAQQWQALCETCDDAPPWTSDLGQRLDAFYGRKEAVEVWESGARSFTAQVAQLRAELDDAQEKCAKERQERASERIGASLRVAAERQAQDEERRALDQGRLEKEERERHAAEVASALEWLADDASTEDRSAVMRQAEKAAAASPGRRSALLLQLSMNIQSANKNTKERQLAVQKAKELREELGGLSGAEVEELDAMLQQVAKGEAALPQDMEQRVTDAAARATEEFKRDYVMEVVTDELEALGYVVEEEFETASADAPQMALRKPGMAEDYHISLSTDPTTAQLEAKVVREAGTEAARRRDAERKRLDRQVEAEWCGDVATALAAAQNQGVQARVVTRHKPGDVPVETIAPFKGWARPKSKSKRRRDRRQRTNRRMAEMSR